MLASLSLEALECLLRTEQRQGQGWLSWVTSALSCERGTC